METNQDPKRKKTRPMVGDRVFSRWRVDGFYYAGQVMHHVDKQHVLVCFDMGILQNTEKHFLITEAESSSNTSKVGKYVLLKTKPVNGMSIIRYVPAIITFQKAKKKPSNTLIVTTYREKQLRVSTSDIVTISENKYNFILKHLARAQKENHEIMYGPEVYFSSPKVITTEISVNSDHDHIQVKDIMHASPDTYSGRSRDIRTHSLGSSFHSQDQTSSSDSGRTTQTSQECTTGRSESTSETLSLCSLETLESFPSPGSQKNQDRFHSEGSHETAVDPNETLQKKSDWSSTTLPSPSICSTTFRTGLHSVAATGRDPKDCIQQQKLEVERQTLALMQEMNNELKRMKLENRNRVPSIQPPKESLEQVLVKNPATGWYSPGRLIHNYNNEAFLVQTEEKTLKTLYPQDIIEDNEGKSTVIQHLFDFDIASNKTLCRTYNQTAVFPKNITLIESRDIHPVDNEEGDAVVCPYPMIDVQYCPAEVLQDLPLMWLKVRYYDGTEGYVAREETYVISDTKKEEITAEIISQEESIIGRTVVARNDKDGLYYIGTVAPREWKGPRFVIEWTDGSQSIQLTTHMFAILPEMHDLSIGSHVIALADSHPESFAYMPGMVMKTNNKEWQVQFINGQSALLLHRHQMYRISEKYYKLSEMFFEKVHQ